MEGFRMAPLAKIPAEAARRVGLHSAFLRSRYGGWFALRPTVFFSPSDWNRTPSLQSTVARALPNLIVLT